MTQADWETWVIFHTDIFLMFIIILKESKSYLNMLGLGLIAHKLIIFLYRHIIILQFIFDIDMQLKLCLKICNEKLL